MGERSSRHFWCDVCELGTGPAVNDIPEGQLDTELPPDWVLVVASRATVNPALADARAERARLVEEQMAAQVNAVLGMARSGGEEIPDAALDQIRASARAQAESLVPEVDEPPYIIELARGHLCPEHAQKLQVMDMEPFQVEFEDEP